ncbi:MAG: MBOAT family O-acyltransferase [Caulobacteraceae bacterium]
MLFNSFIFIFGFLPLVLVATFVLGRWKQGWAKVVLALASLAFYALARPRDLPLLVGSVAFNYVVGTLIQRAFAGGRPGAVRLWLWLGVAADLALLGWFKYADFVAGNIAAVFHTTGLPPIALPLAISFFTFQNIAWLVDQSRGRAGPLGVVDFTLFVTFFPKLISGPLVHYEEFVPQTQTRRFGRLNWRNIMIGLVIFAIGLFKKTVIADSLAPYVNPLFAAGGKGAEYTLVSGWLAAISYTFQLYFDFSGYSDMAIGVARLFGLKLPINFHSPLRAPSVTDYWRRWNMTLQRLIVSYVFDPLSLPLNRLAARLGLGGWSTFVLAVGAPIFVTFVAVGLWHGAGWTFILFGSMHGLYVSINEAWRERGRRRRRKARRAGRVLAEPGWARIALAHVLTVIAVAFANVMFRAKTVGAAIPVWAGMTGFGGAAGASYAPSVGLLLMLLLSAAIVFLAPNTQQIMGRFDPAQNWGEWRETARAPLAWTWKPSLAGLLFAGLVLFLGLMFIQAGQAVFLYFQF